MYGKPSAVAPGAAAVAAQGLKPKETPSSKVIQVGSRHGDSGTKVVPNQGQGKNGGLDKGHGTDINGNHNQGTGNTGSLQQDNSHGIDVQPGHGNGISQTPGSQVQSPGSSIANNIEKSAPHGSPAEAIQISGQATSSQGAVSQPFSPGNHESTGSTGSDVVSQPSLNPGNHVSAGSVGSLDSGHFAPSGMGAGMHDLGSSMPASMPASMPGQAMDSVAHSMEAVSNSPIGQMGHTYLTFALAPQDLQILHSLPGNIEQTFAILFVKTVTIWLPAAIFAGLCIVSTSFSFVRLWRGERQLRKQGKKK